MERVLSRSIAIFGFSRGISFSFSGAKIKKIGGGKRPF
jgi:hypothetical protein